MKRIRQRPVRPGGSGGSGRTKMGTNPDSGLLSQFDSISCQTQQPDFELNVAWVKGHIYIEGNETVDKAAKEAARGKSSKVLSLPSLLQPTPSWSALKHRSRIMGHCYMSGGARYGSNPPVMPESPKSTPHCL